MDQLVFCADTVESEVVRRALPDVRVVTVTSRRSLAEMLIGEDRLVGTIVEPHGTDGWKPFLHSVKRSFPLLPILLLVPGGDESGYDCVDRDLAAPQLVEAIRAFFAAPHPTERRRYHRYDWPLRATLECDPIVHRIREISAGGAFLEPLSAVPEPGTRCEIRIEFQNFTMTTTCAILDPRHVSSNAVPGFGVRFDELSAEAASFIDRVVNDALARILLEPDAVPQVPSIDEEEDVLSIGDEFSLSL